MAAADLYLALGSNLGDRMGNLQTALEMLETALGTPCDAISPVLETEAIGFEGPAFLNCVARYKSSKSPLGILRICKDIERPMGRTDVPEYADGGSRIYHDRIIDIDILKYGRRRVDTPELTIPHPQVETRPYIKELLLLL